MPRMYRITFKTIEGVTLFGGILTAEEIVEIRPQGSAGLNGQSVPDPGERMTDPHVKFFATRNPGHAHGDELVCLTELSSANLTAAGRRMTGQSEHAGITG